MDLSKIYVGLTEKNYKLMCKRLSEEVKSGKAKKLQLENWKRYFNWKNEGHKFIITEIYDKPKEKQDNRGKSSIYSQTIELLLMDWLIRTEKPVLRVTRNKILEQVEMINQNYKYCSENIPYFSKYVNIDEKIVYDFFNNNRNNHKKIIETVLKNLSDKSLIFYTEVLGVKTKDNNYRTAEKFEVEFILDCEKRVLNEMGYEKKSQVRVSSRWHEFVNKVNTILREESDILYYYNQYEITVNRKHIEESFKSHLVFILSQLEREQYKQQLNSTTIQRLQENAINRQRTAKNNGKWADVRLREDYIPSIKLIIKSLIDRNTPIFINEVKKLKDTIQGFEGIG